jgi:hypothetical protein
VIKKTYREQLSNRRMADVVFEDGKTKTFRLNDLIKILEPSKREYFLSALSRHSYFIDEKGDTVFLIKNRKYLIKLKDQEFIGKFSHFLDYNNLVFKNKEQTLIINQHEYARFLLYMN